jgi:hypothetical protein
LRILTPLLAAGQQQKSRTTGRGRKNDFLDQTSAQWPNGPFL